MRNETIVGEAFRVERSEEEKAVHNAVEDFFKYRRELALETKRQIKVSSLNVHIRQVAEAGQYKTIACVNGKISITLTGRGESVQPE